MIYGIEGLYGSGKTSYGVYLMKNDYKNHTIWTNIQVDQNMIPNAIIFPDRDILEVMKTINCINDLEREKYSTLREGSNVYDHNRDAFTRHVIFFDEGSSHLNARDWKQSQTAIFQYLDQERKLFLDIYVLTPSSQTIDIAYRRMIQAWIQLDQFAQMPILRNIRTAKAIYKDQNGNPILESFISKDDTGTPIMKQRPVIQRMGWFYAPKYWKAYDDLYKNISIEYTPQSFYLDIINTWFADTQDISDSSLQSQELKKKTFLDFLRFRKTTKQPSSENIEQE